MLKNFKSEYDRYYKIFEGYLNEVFSSLDGGRPSTITEAMKYAVMNGGKRVRPILCLAAAEMLGVSVDRVKEFSVALECIHSYSLVHDDLPAMDNDDYRRGNLSTHKKFGEANGILAGDALLNFAFETCLRKKNFTERDVNALYTLAEFAGYRGMIAGQVLDLEYENNALGDEKILYLIYENKTSKLITAPLLIASELADRKNYCELKKFGYNLGVLFQITDDIMDVEGSLESIGKTPHKDEGVNKLTAIKVFGLDGAKVKAEMHYNKCKEILSNILNSFFLSEFTDVMFKRKS